MTQALISLLILIVAQLSEREVARQCKGDYCAVVSIAGDVVKYRQNDPARSPYEIGPYVGAAQQWVPRNEAPIRVMTTPNGWRAVVSACLDEFDEYATMRLRLFDPTGKLQEVYDGNYFLDDIEAGMLFGTPDVVLSLQTGGASASVQDTRS